MTSIKWATVTASYCHTLLTRKSSEVVEMLSPLLWIWNHCTGLRYQLEGKALKNTGSTVRTSGSKYLSHMRRTFTDRLASELEFPKQKHWPRWFFAQTLRENGIYELRTVFFTNQERAKETQSVRNAFISTDKLILNRHFQPHRDVLRWNLSL